MNKGFYDRIFNWHFPNVPDDWNPTRVDELFEERTETSSDVEKYPLFSLTIENGVTPKTDRYERSFLLKDKAENQYKVVYPKDFVFNPMNLRFGAISYSQQEKIVTVSAYYNILRPIREQYSPLIEAIFKSHAMMNVYDVIAIGSLIEKRRVHWSVLKDVLIPLPPLAEQKAIAQILGTWDEAIATTEALIEALTLRKRALMQRLLTGEVRFPGFVESDETQETKFGDIPADWDYVQIKDIAKSVSRKNKADNEFPVLSCTKYDGLVDSLEYFGRQIYSDNLSTYKIVKCNQFAYATNHIEEGSIGYQDLYDDALVSPMYTVFETTKKVNDSFLYRVLKTELYRHIFEINTSASVNRRGSLRWNQFSLIKVPVPSIDEQKAIAHFFNELDELISKHEELHASLQEQKRGLMQVLLTGQVRVEV